MTISETKPRVKTEVQFIEAVQELLRPHNAWTQFCFARGADGREVSSFSDRVVSRCLIGAMDHIFNAGASQDLYNRVFKLFRAEAKAQTDNDNLASLNDNPRMDHARMMDFLGRCHARARQRARV